MTTLNNAETIALAASATDLRPRVARLLDQELAVRHVSPEAFGDVEAIVDEIARFYADPRWRKGIELTVENVATLFDFIRFTRRPGGPLAQQT